jgi:uncharacterized coiled-coil protein SlyX
MAAIKPSSNHPWRRSIDLDVTVANTRNRIEGLERVVREAKAEIKKLKDKLKELADGR